MWIANLFGEIGFPISLITICGDNQGSLFIGSNPVQEKQTKHIDIHYHYIRECIENNKVLEYQADVALARHISVFIFPQQHSLLPLNMSLSTYHLVPVTYIFPPCFCCELLT